MDLLAELDRVIAEIQKAKPVPFSASAMIDRRKVLDRLERIRQAAPQLITGAEREQQLRTELQSEAQRIAADAQAERDRVLDGTEVVQAAHRRAEKIIQSATRRSEQLRAGAEDYIDSRLAGFEVVLQKTLGVVANGRETLKGRLDAAADTGEYPVAKTPNGPP